MKIDRSNFSHWACLALYFLQCVIAVLLRFLPRRGPERVLVLYGHKLNGNLLALHEEMAREPDDPWVPVFLTMDIAYLRQLKAAGVRCVWACGPGAALLLWKATAVVSDHGLHSMQPLVDLFRRTGLRFFDVWHGIPFKGFDASDFGVQHRYDEIWVASEACRDLYVARFGFAPDKVVATGYARTDRLLRPSSDKRALRASLGLPETGPLFLFAPTWTQDVRGRRLFPFGCSQQEFLDAVAAVASDHGGGVILRLHLNSGSAAAFAGYPNVYPLSAAEFPDTESILLASDVLVCDWSSIAFDYLLLDRPVIFLDVEPPFRKGFSFGPEYRFGPVAESMRELLKALAAALDQVEYWKAHGARHAEIRSLLYGELADGHAAERCLDRLRQHTDPGVRIGSSR